MITWQHMTMQMVYQEICDGEDPWIALGDFVNDFFDYASDHRETLIKDPLQLPQEGTEEAHKWAVFCAASVEYLCHEYSLPCPAWIFAPEYAHVTEPWFFSEMAATKPQVRERYEQETPREFRQRNIYCGRGERIYTHKLLARPEMTYQHSA
jgi:hypothetical protein